MARRTKLRDALQPASHDDATTTDGSGSDQPATDDAAETAPEGGSGGRAGKTAAAKKSPAKKASGKKAAAAKASGAKPTGAKAPSQPSDQSSEPVVLGVDTQDAKRLSIYLHPDDHRELALARAENGTDANSLIRAMIALWRANPRVRRQIDRLARTAPRGGQGGASSH